ncbi:MAG: adenylate/guanylate cyclase domain-containing protein [Pseudomonadota bacterium]
MQQNADLGIKPITNWLITQGIEGTGQADTLDGYCTRILAAGIPIMRVHVAQRAYHPEFGSISFDWNKDEGIGTVHLAHVSTPREQWVRSPLYHLLSEDIVELRETLRPGTPPHRFPFLDELRDRGGTDYFAAKMRFENVTDTAAVDPNNTPEGLVISWVSDAPEGFSDAHVETLRALLPALGLALKAASNRQMANDVAATYLGADAGQRVLSGEIQRGSFETISAVIWYFDLRSFTRISEETDGPQTIAMLNAYFGQVVEIVENRGGNVLKFMGDGLLAIFRDRGGRKAVDEAIAAANELRTALTWLNQERRADNQVVTDYSLALHAGDLSYGNIGGKARLDFTVIGPAVNQTARILDFCSQLGRPLILSEKVAKSATRETDQIVSLGRYMLRGVSKPQELFTLWTPAE